MLYLSDNLSVVILVYLGMLCVFFCNDSNRKIYGKEF